MTSLRDRVVPYGKDWEQKATKIKTVPQCFSVFRVLLKPKMAPSFILVIYSLMFCINTHGFYETMSKYNNTLYGLNVVLQKDSKCQAGLIGVSSGSKGTLPNSAMSASSSHENYPAHSGRLLSNEWWMPAVHDKSQYLKVDLLSLAVVRKSAVQGSGDSTTAGARVISYFLYHSIDEDIWFPALEKENARLFVGNINNSEVISNSSFAPFLARYVKFCPQRWNKEIALRVELYGCKAEGLNNPIGMELKSITDDSITATSMEGNTFQPSSARLHLNIAGGGWCAKKSLHDVPQYLQVDLDRSWALIAVATQGIESIQSWVSEYYLSTTFDHKVWIFVHDFTGKKLLKGNSDPPGNVVMHHLPSFTWASGVRIHPHDWNQSICLRVEFYGMDSKDSFTINDEKNWCDDNAELRGPNSVQFLRTCFCSPGYEGDSLFHCEDVDECSIGDNVCGSPERNCTNTPGSFNCDCGPGTTKKGDNCEDIDECANATDVCPFLTVCVNTVGSFICDCREPGFLADGKQCLDIDECKIGNHTCKENSVCVNALGSFACFCTVGYTGWNSPDGKQQCSDIDECAITPKLCDNNGECVNTVGSYYCLCKKGFVARGSECEDLDECASSPAVCEHDALCVNLPGSYACQCKLGYHLTDSLCQDVNECQQNLAECHHRADCYNTDGSYLCVCKTGLYGDGFFCSNTDHCSKEDEECNAALKREEEQSGVNVEVLKKSNG